MGALEWDATVLVLEEIAAGNKPGLAMAMKSSAAG
jgi:hypothetical protein